MCLRATPSWLLDFFLRFLKTDWIKKKKTYRIFSDPKKKQHKKDKDLLEKD